MSLVGYPLTRKYQVCAPSGVRAAQLGQGDRPSRGCPGTTPFPASHVVVTSRENAARRGARMLGLFRGIPLSILLGFVLLSPSLVEATSTVAVPVSELVRLSPVIVHGTVLSTASRWNEDHSLIVTDVRIGVITTLRGEPRQEITVVQPGGRVGKLRVDVDGAAVFLVGEELVLFLAPDGNGALAPVGMNQGGFKVKPDPRTGRKRMQETGSTSSKQQLSLESFLDDVRVTVRQLPKEKGD